VFSTSPEHIDENIASTDFEMSDEDYQKLTDFRPPSYNPPAVNWETESIDDDIVALANSFEEHFQNND
jgi:diketogulonate reductase-like aldo/keto reductase